MNITIQSPDEHPERRSEPLHQSAVTRKTFRIEQRVGNDVIAVESDTLDDAIDTFRKLMQNREPAENIEALKAAFLGTRYCPQ